MMYTCMHRHAQLYICRHGPAWHRGVRRYRFQAQGPTAGFPRTPGPWPTTEWACRARLIDIMKAGNTSMHTTRAARSPHRVYNYQCIYIDLQISVQICSRALDDAWIVATRTCTLAIGARLQLVRDDLIANWQEHARIGSGRACAYSFYLSLQLGKTW